MKLFIWEGDGISDAYHDGTLVVLAESPEQARELVRAKKLGAASYYRGAMGWDGSDEALDRAPDRVIDILADTPAQVVAFNGGGYD